MLGQTQLLRSDGWYGRSQCAPEGRTRVIDLGRIAGRRRSRHRYRSSILPVRRRLCHLWDFASPCLVPKPSIRTPSSGLHGVPDCVSCLAQRPAHSVRLIFDALGVPCFHLNASVYPPACCPTSASTYPGRLCPSSPSMLLLQDSIRSRLPLLGAE